MQCPSCQFENMPGITVCGRCGARLQFSPAEIEVHPPRASQRAKRLRRWFPWYRWAAVVRSATERIPALRVPELDGQRLPWGVCLRMVVPGWPQTYTGQRQRGRWMLGLFLVLFAAGMVAIGTSCGALLLGTAVAVHISSIMDVLWPIAHDPRDRALAVLVGVVAVGAVVYAPPVWLLSQIVGVRRIAITAGPLQAGDVFLYRPGRAVNTGDVVLYEIPRAQVPTRTATGYAAVYRVQGEYVDRIIARAGQAIVWEDGRLYVDGQRAPFQPLHPDTVTTDLRFTVPQGYYGILPSTQPQDAPPFPPDIWQALSLVRPSQIRGRVVLRQWPLWRWGRLSCPVGTENGSF